jgi:hypothetical protein
LFTRLTALAQSDENIQYHFAFELTHEPPTERAAFTIPCESIYKYVNGNRYILKCWIRDDKTLVRLKQTSHVRPNGG